MRSLTKRAIGVAGLGSMTAVLAVAGIGTAQAADQTCPHVRIEHSLDGGQTWTTAGRINGDVPTKVTVRIQGDVQSGCGYNISLASYSAQGPSWQTSGTQAFLGWDHTTLTSENKQATLDIGANAPTCFGQVDLYGNDTKYDGSDSDHALPLYPTSRTPTDLITAWNGGTKCSTETPTPTPTETSASPTPTETSASPTPTETSASPTPTETSASPTPTETSASPTATPTTTAPAVDDTTSPSPTTTSTAPPVGSPVVPPSSSKPSGDLAETGGNGSQTVLLGAGGVALLAIGGGAVYFTRRRNRSAHL